MAHPLIKAAGQKSCYMIQMALTFLSFRLEFPCSNDEAEYDTLIIGLIFVFYSFSRQTLSRQTHYKLIIQQVTEEFTLKEIILASH